MKKMIAIAAAGIFALPALASAQIVGQCADCHTMHNSEQGQRVAVRWDVATGTYIEGAAAIQNLLRMDCISCHANPEAEGPTLTLEGGSIVPQVYHTAGTSGDLFADNLAGGNFAFLAQDGDRKGHNVIDLFNNDVLNGAAAPGDIRSITQGHNFANFTCAGARGCHGTRSQLLDGYTDETTNTFVYSQMRTGIAAVSGAHHNSVDGAKDPAQMSATNWTHDGAYLADSYRFISGLKGYGNEDARWQNLDETSHNEYYGSTAAIAADGCNRCHVPGDPAAGGNARMTYDSSLKVPNQSMSGFCSTCHGNFHSSGNTFNSTDGGDFFFSATTAPNGNGTGGAFLRHPSDYAIKASGEYTGYTTWDPSAPVARASVFTEASSTINHGSDMVMCLSCHMAHASPHDGMLRFDYADMIAGAAEPGTGCLACHTTKGQ